MRLGGASHLVTRRGWMMKARTFLALALLLSLTWLSSLEVAASEASRTPTAPGQPRGQMAAQQAASVEFVSQIGGSTAAVAANGTWAHAW